MTALKVLSLDTTTPKARVPATGDSYQMPVTLNAATGNEVAFSLDYTVNKATSGNDTGLVINQTDTASPGTSLLLDLQVGGTKSFSFTTAKQAYLWNLFTDESNYERGFMRWSSNVLEIGTEAAGTGTVRPVKVLSNGTLSIGGAANIDIVNVGANNANGGIRLTNEGGEGWFVSFAAGPLQGLTPLSSLDNNISGRAIWGQSGDDLNIYGGFGYGNTDSPHSGGRLYLRGGGGSSAASTAAANGGDVVIRGGTATGTGNNGHIMMDQIPSSDPGVPGAIYRTAGALMVSI